MKRLLATFTLFLLAVPLSACLGDSTFGDTFGTSQSYAEAVPSPEDVELRVPGNAAPNALMLGETARYYSETYRITHEINGAVYAILSILGDIVSYPPTSQSGNRAVWGPFTPALEPTTFMLVVTEVSEGSYEYALMARPKNSTSTDDFAPIVAGRADPEAATGDGSGQLVLDWSTFASMNPNIGLRGRMIVDYSHRPLSWRSVEMLFEDFEDPAHLPGAAPTNVLYRYLENDDTSGDFQFAYRANVHQGDPIRSQLETIRIRSRWQVTGAGRSDVQVHGAEIAQDLETFLDLDQDYVAVAECWDEYFLRTYYNESPVRLTSEDGEPDESTYDGPGQGDPASCVLADSLFADGDVDVFDSPEDGDGSGED